MGSCLSSESRSPIPDSPPTSTLGVKRNRNSKKKQTSRTSSFECNKGEKLHRIPGRLFLNGASEIASLFTQQGKKGTNQDAMIVWQNFGSRTDTVFCGVFDGHGPLGHLVAKRVRDSLPLKLRAHWEVNIHSENLLKQNYLKMNGSLKSDSVFMSADEDSKASAVDLEGTKKQSEFFQTLRESFLKAFKVMDRELCMHANIDCFCSGSTAVTMIKQGRDLVIGNVGDSRAVLGTRDKNDSLFAVQLTVDLKPNLPAEEERIRKCRGRVFALRDEPEVARVWLPNSDSPGLAMARAFGDFCLKDFGLISVPEVSYRRLTHRDEFVVMATDGIWDVLSNQEVVDIVACALSRSVAARAVVETAVRAWRFKYPTSKIDDCAVVCLFLDSNPNNLSILSNAANSHETRACFSELVDNITTENDSCKNEMGKDSEVIADLGREWSALEGVSRVNTLLTLPRFDPGKDNKKGK